ncbi:MAG: nucleoside-diphosphate kinase [Candidatus Pacearchaeota archaeon]|jgi:nucleoside diphosphate kinase
MAIETAPFFVKPHKIFERKDIFAFLTAKLVCEGGFNLDYKDVLTPPRGFYEEFYLPLKEKSPESFRLVIENYPNQYGGMIALALVSGSDIFNRLDIISGPTRYKDNPPWTIRGKFGPYEMPNTICHASRNQKEAEHDLMVLKKFDLI